MLPGQLSLPNMTGPALVVGPVFLCMELTGKPGHKGRHRSRMVFPRQGKPFIHNYPDPESDKYERTLGEAARWMMGRRQPTENPVALLVHAFIAVPKSWSNKDREAALAGAILPTGRPDGDNYLKAAQDALNEIVWRDDSLVCDARVIKRYSSNPALRIEVREFLPPEQLRASDRAS